MNCYLEDEMCIKYEYVVNVSEGKCVKIKIWIFFGLIVDDLDLVELIYFRN